MYAACPSCKALYHLEPVHLRAASGKVRCGKCQAVFNAASAAFEEPQQALDYAEQHRQGIAQEIDDLIDRALDEVSDAAAGEVSDAAAGEASGAAAGAHFAAAAAPADVPPAAAQDTHDWSPPAPVADAEDRGVGNRPLRSEQHADFDFTAWPANCEYVARRSRTDTGSGEAPPAFLFDDPLHHEQRTSWGAIAAVILLTALLLGQYAWTERYRLADTGSLRPLMELFCRHLECDLPLRRDVNKVEMVEYEVRDHPHVDDALLINATLVNRADFVQAFPAFEVSFSDLSGTPISMRRFLPDEYVVNQKLREKGLAPGGQAHILLEVVDPGERAVSFQFYFF
jgi:predicted Zn finger-like uncharacterized protein